MKKILLFILLSGLSLVGFSGTIIVVNTNDAGPGSLRQAVINANNNDTITFDPVLIGTGNATVVLNSGEIVFSKNLTIIGLITAADTLFITPGINSRSFSITGGTSKFDKIAVVDGLVPDPQSKGGGLYVEDAILTITNSVVRGNEVTVSSFNTNSYGGGVYAKNTTLIIDNSLIINNEASTFFGYSSYGGGIYVDSSILTITNSEISMNTVSVSSPVSSSLYATYGAGIAALNSMVVINGSIINENFALNNSTSVASQGGGVYSSGASSSLAVSNSVISKNFALTSYSSNNSAFGGGIYSSSPLTITNSIIDSNDAAGSYSAIGGGVYCENHPLTITNSTIINNRAVSSTITNIGTPSSNSNGGGVYSSFPLTIDSSFVSNNKALFSCTTSTTPSSSSSKGGGVSSPSTISISNSTISDNIASSSIRFSSSSPLFSSNGGGVYSTSLVTITNSTINDNEAYSHAHYSSTPIYSSNGGGVYSSSLVLTNTTLTRNKASTTTESSPSSPDPVTYSSNGGGVYSAVANIKNSTLYENEAFAPYYPSATYSSKGGGVYNSSSLTMGSNIIGFGRNGIVNSGVIGELVFGSIDTNNGYNVFGSIVSDTVYGTDSTDQLITLKSALNLGALQNNGGNTFTMMPGTGSIAIDMGNPADFTDAQNTSILDLRRDVGAAEFACVTTYYSYTDSICSGDSLLFDGAYLKIAGIYKDTLLNTSTCDSIVTLNLSVKTNCFLPVQDSCSGLIISEYIEGSSFNKAIEIYNASPSSINLSQYTIKVYSNGSASGTSIPLSGSVGSYDVFIISNSSANTTIISASDLTSGSLNFTGNDAVSLERNDTLIDLIGIIGVDPGTQWGSGTQNHTLVRKSNIIGGVKLNPGTFDPITEWDIYAVDELSYLENHTNDCGNTTSINDELKSESIVVYPNPSSTLISVLSVFNKEFEYSLFSVNGKVMSSGKISDSKMVDVSSFVNGIYILSLRGEGVVVTKRIIINH